MAAGIRLASAGARPQGIVLLTEADAASARLTSVPDLAGERGGRPMRTLEVVLIAVDAAVLLPVVLRSPRRWWQVASEASSARRWPRAELVLLVVLLLPLLGHLVIERHRFVMVPAYAVTVVLACVLLVRWFRWDRPSITVEPRRRRPVLRVLGRIAALVVGVLALVVSSAAGLLLPVFNLPTPTGPYAVGYTEDHLTDSDRREWTTPDANDLREVEFSIWYPTEAGTQGEPLALDRRLVKSTALNASDKIGTSRARGLLEISLNHFRLIDTHAVRGGEVVQVPGGFPVIFYSPGSRAGRFDNTSLMVDLASRGYVVVAVDHPYTSNAPVTLANGRQVDRDTADTVEMSAEESLARMTRSVSTNSADLSFVLDHLTRLNADPGGPFHDRLDLDSVGALGFSFGGATAEQALADDSRFDAGVNMDGTHFGSVRDTGVPSPSLNILATGHIAEISKVHRGEQPRNAGYIQDARFQEQFHDRSTGPTWAATIESTNHVSHDLFSFVSPALTGNTAQPQTEETIRALVADFFDHTLRGRESGLLGRDCAVPRKVHFPSDPARPDLQ